MAIVASGQVSLADFRTEYVGGSSQISMADLYRGGSYIKANAGDNTATNLAASVPTSGEIEFADFFSTEKGWKKTYSAGATNQSVAGIFGDDEDVDYPKFIDINSGVTIGGTGGTAALTIGASLAGSLTIDNSGTIVGTGGTSGGAGGNAIACSASGVTLNNTSNGIIAGGGGAGGAGGAGGTGGTGGSGYSTNTVREPSSGYSYNEYNLYWSSTGGSSAYINWNGSYTYTSFGGSGYSFTSGGITYYRGNTRLQQEDNSKSEVARQYSSTSYYSGGSGGAGGAGGAGGNGQGYSQAQSSGSAGSGGSAGASGGTNAGTGGTGGTGGAGGDGGTYGNAGSSGATGSTGSTGASGNNSGGSAGSSGSGGSSGGAAGAATSGTSITINNSGNVYGATA